MNDAPKSAPDTPQGAPSNSGENAGSVSSLSTSGGNSGDSALAVAPSLNKNDTEDDTSNGPSEDNRQGDPIKPGSESSGSDDIKTVVAPANTGFVQEVFDKQVEAAEAQERFNDPKQGPETVEKGFTIVQHLDPARQADPNGVYLDDIQRHQAEAIRARVEGREPDFENPGTTAGDVVVPTETARQYGDGNSVAPVAFQQEVLVGSPQTEDLDDEEQSDEDSDKE